MSFFELVADPTTSENAPILDSDGNFAFACIERLLSAEQAPLPNAYG
jgi:hypothetical protein